MFSFFIVLSVRREFRLGRRDCALRRRQGGKVRRKSPPPCALKDVRQAYTISHIPAPEGRRPPCVIFPVAFKKQPGVVRVVILGCSKCKGGAKRNHARVIRQPVTVALNLPALVNTT